METIEKGAGKTFDISFAMTDEEIALLMRLIAQRQNTVAGTKNYLLLIVFTGILLASSGGAIAHSYFGLPLDSHAAALVMALFVAFIAGVFMQLRGSTILSKRLLSHRRASLKKTVHVQMSSDGIAYSKTATKWHAAWEEVGDVTVIGAAAFFWLSDTGFLVPLRAIPEDGEREAFIRAAKAWCVKS